MTFISIFSLFFRENKINVSSKSSARQRIHMKNQAIFSSKDKSKKLKCRLLQFLLGALRVNILTVVFKALDKETALRRGLRCFCGAIK